MIALSFYRSYIRHPCFNMSLFFPIALGLAACPAWAQTANAPLLSSRARIVQDQDRIRAGALAVRRKMGNPSEVSLSQIHLADVALARHRFKKAERLALQGMQGMRSSVDPFRTGMLSAWMTLTYARCLEGHNAEGLMSAEQAVAFAVGNYESESAAVGFALETLGFAQWKTGAAKDAENTMLQGLRMLRRNLAPADPRLAAAMLQYRAYLAGTNRVVEAEQIQQQVTRMNGESGISCAGCAVSVSSLSKTLR
jgi:hypothetical protein